ncbi:hypothetical protein PPYR_13216 [Photinus pyralis]|uniref:Uncharacterized protein n=1 Tax=Photinus pyralis TaxID=7054 RepID=A0A1Y1N6K0_PHOPY|nr:uncharacterized protein LOC116178213 [Photinus pyralis]KAB0793596.1 hypothetical protein PPYR_13216 [Photinus pyralis]
MPSVVLCLFLVMCALPQILSLEFPKHFESQEIRNCETEVNPDKNYNFLDENLVIKNDPRARSFVGCVFRKYKMIHGGEFVKDTTIDYLVEKTVPFFKPHEKDPRHLAEEAFELCKGVKGAGIGERAVNFSNCVNAHFKA